MSRLALLVLVTLAFAVGAYRNLRNCAEWLRDAGKETSRHGRPFLHNDPVSLDDERFALAAAFLPKRGVVGYVGYESASDGKERRIFATWARHAQYSLAPLIVHESGDHGLVLGNYPDLTETPQELPGHPGLKLAHDCAPGLGVYCRTPEKH